jgi:hypothetical protein
MKNYKKSSKHCEKKLEILSKSLELIEKQMGNCIQNMHTVATTVIGGIVAIYIYIIKFYSENGNSVEDKTFPQNIIIALLTIPLIVCIITTYLISHQRTLVYDSNYAEYLEDSINRLLRDPILYYGKLTVPLYVSRDYVRMIVGYSLIILYFIPFVINSSKYTLCDLFLLLFYYEPQNFLSTVYKTPFILLNVLNVYLLVYVLFSSGFAIFSYLYGSTIKEYCNNVKEYFENYKITGEIDDKFVEKNSFISLIKIKYPQKILNLSHLLIIFLVIVYNIVLILLVYHNLKIT